MLYFCLIVVVLYLCYLVYFCMILLILVYILIYFVCLFVHYKYCFVISLKHFVEKNVKNIFLNADFMCILFIYVTVSLIFFVLFYFASLYFILDMNTYYGNIHMYMYIHSYVYLYMYIYGNMCYFSKRL